LAVKARPGPDLGRTVPPHPDRGTALLGHPLTRINVNMFKERGAFYA